MSTELPERNFSLNLRGCHVTVVASTYNEKFTNALVENCTAELAQIAPLLDVDVVRVPGAFEVPMMVKQVIEAPLRQGRPSAVIALGVILRGSTAHADLIGTAITEKLLDLSVNYMLPVIHEVLLLDSEEQAFARCIALPGRSPKLHAKYVQSPQSQQENTPLTSPKRRSFPDAIARIAL